MDKRAEDFQPVGPEDHLDGQGYYTEADIDRIIATCPTGLPETMVDFPRATLDGRETVLVPTDRRTALKARLNDSATPYRRSRKNSKTPPPSKTAKQFRRAEKSLRNALDALGQPEGGIPGAIPKSILYPLRQAAGRHGARIGGFPGYPPMERSGGRCLDPNGPAVVRDAIQLLQYLTQWSAEAAENAEQEMRRPKKRHTGDPVLQDLIGDLTGIWIEIFDQDIKTSMGAEGSARWGQAGGPMIRFIRACIEPLGLSLDDSAIRTRIRLIQKGLRPMTKKSSQQKT
jgi:hypothetical protein